MLSLCAACSLLKLERSDFTSPIYEPADRDHAEALSSTFGALRRTRETCDFCRLVWRAMEQDDKKAMSERRDDTTWSLLWGINTSGYKWDPEDDNAEGLFGSALYPTFDGSLGGYAIQLIDEDETDGFLRGRLVPDAIDADTLRRWVSRCQHLHGEKCRNTALEARPISATTVKSLTVIDVENLCLCVLPSGAAFTALSYVWGNSNRPVSLLSNQGEFFSSGSLSNKLPRTIQDAVEVTKALEIEFIWVDSLCIVQDDATQKSRLIDNMDCIYSAATVTLVAATGAGAHSGLSGWSNKDGRKVPMFEIDMNIRLGVLPYYQQELIECDHARRAWTYQETCLAQRCLVFLNGFVYFNCNVDVYAEHTNAELTGVISEASASVIGKAEVNVSILQQYFQHVVSYTSRRMTFQSDGLNAFSGIAQALSRSMSVKQLLFGMPTSCFDWAVLWNDHGELRRRRGFPSWSWVGWTGAVIMPSSLNGDYDQRWLLKGTWVNWHLVERQGTCQLLWDSRDENNTVSARLDQAMSGLYCQPETESTDTEMRREEAVDIEVESVERVDVGNDGDDDEDGGDDDGEDSIDDDDDDEDDVSPWPCPTYGQSTPGDPFGRIIHTSAMDLIPQAPESMSGSCFDLCLCDAPNSLCFSAPTIALSPELMTILQTSSARPRTSTLHDEKGRVCGSLYMTDSESSLDTKGVSLKLLLISVSSYASLSSYHYSRHASMVYKDYEMDADLEEYLERPLPEDLDNFDFLNVLCVKETELKAKLSANGKYKDVPVHERAGVGLIYRNALQSLEVSWLDIVLA